MSVTGEYTSDFAWLFILTRSGESLSKSPAAMSISVVLRVLVSKVVAVMPTGGTIPMAWPNAIVSMSWLGMLFLHAPSAGPKSP